MTAAIGALIFAGVSGLAAWKKPDGADLGRLIGTPGSLEAAPVTARAQVAGPATSVAAMPASQAASPLADNAARRGPAPADTTRVAVSVPVNAFATPAAAPQPAAATPAPASSSVPPAPLQPIVSEGRTDLQNGIYALRSGDTVTVHFDTPEARTRRPEKLEQIVRATLPQVHGRAAGSMLAGIAGGTLVPAGDSTEVPIRTISLRGPNGEALSLLPQTRPGRDGPLVVAYRVTPAR